MIFFLQNTSCIRKPQVISEGGGVRTPCTLPLDPPLHQDKTAVYNFYHVKCMNSNSDMIA